MPYRTQTKEAQKNWKGHIALPHWEAEHSGTQQHFQVAFPPWYKHCNLNTEHQGTYCGRWHTMWRSICLLSKHFTKPIVLWQYKRQFWRNSTGYGHQHDLKSAIWYRSLNYLALSATRKVWWDGKGCHACKVMLLMYGKCCFGVWENLWHNVPSHLVSKEHQHIPSCDTDAHCSQQIAEM